jgi:hypothetical protein
MVNINIKQLLAEGNDPEIIEEMLNIKLKSLDHMVDDIDFYVDVDNVAKIVQPITDQILKDL